MPSSLDKISGIVTRFKGLTTIGFANIIANVISGLFWLYIARLLGTTHYGEISYLIAASAIAVTISFLGSGNILLVYTAKGVKIQSTVYSISILASAIAAVILFLIFQNIGVSLFVIGNVIFGLVTNEIIGQKLYKQYSVYMIGQKILGTVLAIALNHFIGPNGVILGIAISFFLPTHRIYAGFREYKIDFSLLKARSGFIINSYIMDIARAFSTTLDKIIVAPLLGYALLGNYQLGLQFLSLLGILPGIMFQYILPHDASGNINRKLKKLSIFASVILAILGVFLAPVFLPLLFPKFTEATQVIQILSFSIIATTINLTYISKFLGDEKSKIVLVGSAIYLSIQISSIIILSKMMGINGAAIAVVIATFSETMYLVSMDRSIKKKTNKVSVKEINENSKVLLDKKETNKTDRFHFKYSIPLLISIGGIGLFLRLYYFPYNVPLVLDALNDYFFYATDISILGHLPTTFNIANNGWPIFLSFFFTIFRFDNALDYMTLQRVISISISVLTIVPVYLLCNRFFDKPYAIIGAAIFSFEPRIIQNSLLGITEPLYILLITSALVLFFSSNKKIQYASFGIVALSSIVRAEGLFVFFPMLIIFFVNHRKERRVIAKCALATFIFILIILPMTIFRIQTGGEDALTSRIVTPTNELLTFTSHESNVSKLLSGTITKVESIVKFSGWSLIPIFIFFLPIGLFLIFKKRNPERTAIIVIVISMMLPVIYGFSILPDTRYIYSLFPLFCVISIFTVKSFVERMKNQKKVLVLIIVGILLSSGIFLELKKFDYEHQREAFSVADYVIKITKGVNEYYPESSYLQPAELPEKWPSLSSSVKNQTVIISTAGFDSLSKYIESSESKGLTHLILDGGKNRPVFLNDVFHHEEKYPYLIKIFDSKDVGYKYEVKIYKINYDVFNSMINNSLTQS